MGERSFHIAGGGIAGLAAALGLARIGRDARVLERTAGFETVGAGLQLGPNAVRALQWLGAWESVEPATIAPDDIVIHDGLSGRTLQRIPLGHAFSHRFGQPYRVIRRADLLAALVTVVRSSDRIELRTNNAVTVESLDGSHDLIGADGIFSTIRHTVIPGARPGFRGQAIYRALVSAEAPTPAVSLWLCPGGHVVHYTVGGSRLNIVATVDSSWISERWSEPGLPDEVTLAFGRCADPLRDVLSKPAAWTKWAAADLPRLETWHRGRIALIGDAAHAALPYLAQGAAMALEDAVVLAICVKAKHGIGEAFAAYQALRQPRTSAVAGASRRLGTIYHARGPMRLARNAALGLTGAERFIDRMSWIYGYNPTSFMFR